MNNERLLADLYTAYKDARKNKRSRRYQLEYEFQLEDNLVRLARMLIDGTYTPLPSTCFVIHDPKMREVFAANFRDRIVHHLFYNYTHTLFERTFIYDCYSCIRGRGTHFGIERLKHHIKSVSCNYTRPCYVLKLDIKGYFMSINRNILLGLCRDTLQRMRHRESDIKGKTWDECLNYPFVDFLLEKIICFNPIEDCRIIGKEGDWKDLPREKSLFWANPDCGLPIGNLSSQLFSNVYLNQLDQFVKRELRCRHYGRYVDDAYIVSEDKESLKSLVKPIDNFLHEHLGLSLQMSKIVIVSAYQGVEFLGAYIRPFRTYISTSSLRRIKRKLHTLRPPDATGLQSSVNSFLGVLSHYRSYCLRKRIFATEKKLTDRGTFSGDMLKYRPYSKEPFPSTPGV
ncbi:MAG: RNA-directed DNA polymerase [Lepagella sp.]